MSHAQVDLALQVVHGDAQPTILVHHVGHAQSRRGAATRRVQGQSRVRLVQAQAKGTFPAGGRDEIAGPVGSLAPLHRPAGEAPDLADEKVDVLLTVEARGVVPRHEVLCGRETRATWNEQLVFGVSIVVGHDAAGATLSGFAVTFTGQDTLIATIDSTGLVTAIATGSTTVTVVGDTVQHEISVTVAQIAATVVLTPGLATLTPGAVLTFTAAAEDANGNPIADPNITWSSGDVAVATITGTGTATAVSAGATTIVATSGSVADTANVTVVVVTIDSVDVSPDSLSLNVGGTGNLTAQFFDDQGTEILGPTGTWATTDALVATVTSTGVVTGVGAGTAWISATEDSGADSTYVTVIAVSMFNIEVRYVGTLPSASVQTAFSGAEARWEELLIGDLAAVGVTLAAAECVTVAHPAVAETIDDVVIFAEVDSIDGSGGTLALAGPCVVRSSGDLALVGVMKFDEANLADLEATGDLVETIIHEMGHVLGLGVGTQWSNTLVGTTATTGDPYWPGTEALVQYALASGAATNKVPVENTGGTGTEDGHWRESDMGREVMTGYIHLSSVNPLSAITVGAMEDMRYVVDMSKADTYTVSPTLRISPDRLFRLNELPVPPPIRVDAQGRVVR